MTLGRVKELKALQYHNLIVKPVLEYLNMDSLNARRLIVGTAIIESDLDWIKQLNGVALGFEQVEPATYEDNHDNYLKFKPLLANKVKNLEIFMFKDGEQLAGNRYLSCAHARIKYWRDRNAIPSDAEGLAKYHKRVYNSKYGATKVEKSIPIFEEVIELIKE